MDYHSVEGGEMITRRKLNKKLDLLIMRQNLLAEWILCQLYTYDGVKKLEKQWNELWYEIMEGKKDGKGK